MQQQTILPPIHSFAPDMPLLDLPTAQREEVSKEETAKPTPFTLKEDLGILKCIRAYFGSNFAADGKVPWSFWHTYRKTTGSWRSNSSLYHHWIGSICRKYKVFLENGRLDDCINFVEAEMKVRSGKKICLDPPTVSPQRSHPTPLIALRAQTEIVYCPAPRDIPQHHPLMRNFSMPWMPSTSTPQPGPVPAPYAPQGIRPPCQPFFYLP